MQSCNHSQDLSCSQMENSIITKHCMNTCSDATCEDMLNTQYYQQVQECDRRIHATCESKMKKKTTSRIRIGAQRGFRFTVEPPDGTLR